MFSKALVTLGGSCFYWEVLLVTDYSQKPNSNLSSLCYFIIKKIPNAVPSVQFWKSSSNGKNTNNVQTTFCFAHQ